MASGLAAATGSQAFSDQQHVEIVREALWSGQRGQSGRAAVFVGAGFSFNAQPLSQSVPQFPSWAELTGRLIDRLYPPSKGRRDRSREQALRQKYSTSGFLRLAEEFEATFGRACLSRFIVDTVPDDLMRPGELHRRLVKLPWADIYSTNWDTLLERAAQEFTLRNYATVTIPQAIPRTLSPRIVKLHGSLPDHEPFIITEEDFRTYPRKFAPFVNLMQQAMMENVLCLLGFSGDDPNFLRWAGWVRDELGAASIKIYLCGWLELNWGKAKLLNDLNVVPIDFSKIPEAAQWPEEQQHSLGLEWFLSNLELGEPYNVLQWPKYDEPGRPMVRNKHLEIPRNDKNYPKKELYEPDIYIKTPDDITVSLVAWKYNRKICPPFVTLPEKNRDVLWSYTRIYVDQYLNIPQLYFENDYIINKCGDIEGAIKAIDAAISEFELSFRLERCFIEVPDKIINRFLLYLSGYKSEKTEFFLVKTYINTLRKCVDRNNQKPLASFNEIQSACLSMSMIVVRHFRRKFDQESFLTWISALRSYAKTSSLMHLLLYIDYEECLYSLYTRDIKKILEIMRKWRDYDDDLYWQIRKAGILAELGYLENALSETDSTLQELAKRTRMDCDDLAMLSREGWSLYLRRSLLRAQHARPEHDDIMAIEKRLEALSVLRCDPQHEVQSLTRQLGDNPKFDDVDVLLRHEFVAMALIEDAGFPFFVGGLGIEAQMLLRAAERFEEYDPLTATALFLRIGSVRDGSGEAIDFRRLRKMFQRDNEQKRSRPGIGNAFGLAATAARNQLPELAAARTRDAAEQVRSAGNGVPLRGAVFKNVRDRVALTLTLLAAAIPFADEQERKAALDIAVEYVSSDDVNKVRMLYRPLETLLVEVLDATADALGPDTLCRLACVPLPGFASFDPVKMVEWPEVFRYMPRLPPRPRDEGKRVDDAASVTAETWHETLEWLLDAGRTAEGIGRARALRRLQVLRAWSVPCPEGFWPRVDEVAKDAYDDLHRLDEFERWQWLEFRDVGAIRTKAIAQLVQFFAKTAPIDRRLLRNVVHACSREIAEKENRERLYEPTTDELGRLADNLCDTIAAGKPNLADDGVRRDVARLIAEVLLPALPPDPARERAMSNLVLALSVADAAQPDARPDPAYPVEAVYPPFIAWLEDADAIAEFVCRLQSGLRGKDDARARAAIQIALHWQRDGHEIPAELLRDLTSSLLDPKHPNAPRAISCLHRLYVESGVDYGSRAWDLLTRLNLFCDDGKAIRSDHVLRERLRAIVASLDRHFDGSARARSIIDDIRRMLDDGQHPEQPAGV